MTKRNRANIKIDTIKETKTVQVGTPNRPLERRILQKLIDQFKRVDTIDEVYQYGQTRNSEFSIVLGFKLLTNSDNSKTAAINAVQTALQGEVIDQLLDVFFIETETWYQTVRDAENSLVAGDRVYLFLKVKTYIAFTQSFSVPEYSNSACSLASCIESW